MAPSTIRSNDAWFVDWRVCDTTHRLSVAPSTIRSNDAWFVTQHIDMSMALVQQGLTMHGLLIEGVSTTWSIVVLIIIYFNFTLTYEAFNTNVVAWGGKLGAFLRWCMTQSTRIDYNLGRISLGHYSLVDLNKHWYLYLGPSIQGSHCP